MKQIYITLTLLFFSLSCTKKGDTETYEINPIVLSYLGTGKEKSIWRYKNMISGKTDSMVCFEYSPNSRYNDQGNSAPDYIQKRLIIRMKNSKYDTFMHSFETGKNETSLLVSVSTNNTIKGFFTFLNSGVVYKRDLPLDEIRTFSIQNKEYNNVWRLGLTTNYNSDTLPFYYAPNIGLIQYTLFDTTYQLTSYELHNEN